MTIQQHLSRGLCCATLAALAACGGGGGASTDAPATGAVTISGTAAKGAALAGATIDVRCATGTGSATAAASGAYTVNLANAALPCVLRATGTEGSVFHALVPGSGFSATPYAANITPLSEMIVARVAGATPATYFGAFGSGSTVGATSVSDAVAYVRTALAGVADLTGANPLTDALVVGNALDQKIDALMARLATEGLTLAQLSAAIVANPAAPSVVAAPLAPAATGCSWLRSGRYRMISPSETDPLWRAHVLQVNAATLTATDQNNETVTFADAGGCLYTIDEPTQVNTTMVGPSGILVVHSQSKTVATQRTVTIGLPEQTLPLSEFAGTWNIAGWDPASGIPTPGFIAQTDEITVDAGGTITAKSSCTGTICTSVSGPYASFAANATGGGFNLVEGGTVTGRLFLYKTLAGKAAFMLVADDGQVIIGTRKESLALPAVGTVSYFREFSLNGNNTVSALAENSVTVTAVDTAANTITRLRASDGRVDTLGVNRPQAGLRHRALNTCSVSGVASNCAEVAQLVLPGMGITLSLSVGLTNPATAFYFISVARPEPLT